MDQWWEWLLVAVAGLALAIVIYRRFAEPIKLAVLKVRSPGYQVVASDLQRYRQLCLQLPRSRYRSEISAMLRNADTALHNAIGPIILPQYETAWADVHRARGELALHLSLREVFAELVPDIRDDCDYLPQQEANRVRREVTDIQKQLLRSTSPRRQTVLRTQLQEASETARRAREETWLKTDMKRTRITIMGVLLALTVAIGIGSLSAVLNEKPAHPSWLFFLSLGAFGASGGIISSLYSPESITGRVRDFYVNRRLLYLRPVIGSALALASFLAIRGGVASVFKLNANETSPAAFMFVAVAAGFSERAFVKRLFGSSDSDDRDSTSHRNS